MPAAEEDVSADRVLRLLTEQHPDLAALPLSAAANGWDNAIFRLGPDLAVRLPRRQAAAELIRNEQRWLPELSRDLATLTPVPLRTGAPSSFFPWHWSIVPWVHGSLAADLPPEGRAGAADDLAQFVLAFQQPAPTDAPRNAVRGVPLAARSAAVEERITAAELPQDLLELWFELRDQPDWHGPALWLHGDLHPANLVLGTGGGLAGVLDFGDLTAGDPATDLAAAWLVFDRAGRRSFIRTINRERSYDAATWQRARGWALCIGTALAAASDDHPAFRAMGMKVLAEVRASDGVSA